MLLKQHLDMIGRNEPIQRKAKFWQSYVRALKGTDDMKAPELTHYSRPRSVFRPLLTDFPTWPSKSIYEDPIHPSDRITVPGYRYVPVSRETYGISPRPIYSHHFSSPRFSTVSHFKSDSGNEDVKSEAQTITRHTRLEPVSEHKPDDPIKYLAEDEWDAHERRLEAIDELLPMKYRYPHYYRPRSGRASSVPPPRSSSVPPTTLRALSRARSTTPAPPHLRDIIPEEKTSPGPIYTYTGEKLSSRSFNESMSKAVTSYSGATSTSTSSDAVTRKTFNYTPIRSTRINSEIIHAYFGHNDVYNWPGEPLYHRPYFGSYVRRPLSELLEPSIYMPRSRITRDPWWWDYPTLRPYSAYNRYPYSSYYSSLPYSSSYWRTPYYLRDSYLSPVKRTYLWSYHPHRPFSYNYYWI